MKKQLVLLLIFALSGFFACQNADKKQIAGSEANSNQMKVAEQNETPYDEDLQQSNQTEDLANEKALNKKTVFLAESIKVGDEICGMTVKSIEFIAGGLFEIQFEGIIDLQGRIYDNQHDSCMEFETENPKCYVEIDRSEHALLKYLIISNEASVQSEMTENEINTYNEGLPVAFNSRVKNPSYNIYFSDKGRQRFGEVSFVRRN
ncbi:MAG: hypothetical protein U9N51_07230 [Bacteroidota bacterium]|nr:hypothetical protein [Bacteroidota bacterium]